MNNLYLKYLFVGCLVLFLMLYFTYPKIIKSLKERLSHTDETCKNECDNNANSYGTLGTYEDCFDACKKQQ